MRGLSLTLTWIPIILVLLILVTSLFPTQAQSRERTITKAQIEQVIKNFKQPESGGESPQVKLKRILDCTQSETNQACDGVSKSLVIKELLLRLQIREMGEACTSDGNYSTALYGSPYRTDRLPHRPTAENSKAYQAWQDELLDSGLTFCDPFKHLSCSPISKICECRPGTVWKPEENKDTCSVIVGGYCWIPGVDPGTDSPSGSVALYDPLTKDFYGDNRIYRLGCSSYRGICFPTLAIFPDYICPNKEINDLDEELGGQFRTLPSLNFGEACNLEHQTQLYTTTEEEMKDYNIRVKNLKAILAAQTPFCDVKLRLICGSAGKCECIEPTIYNNDTKLCTFRSPHETCPIETPFEIQMRSTYPWRVIFQIRQGFRIARGRECPYECTQAKFPRGGLVQPTFEFCRSCPETQGLIQLVGKNCDKSLTGFLEGAPPPSFPIDIPDYDKQLELFVQFNEKAKEFEKLFRLEKNSQCDYAGELEVYRSIRRIRNVEVPDKIFTGQNYKDLISSMDNHIGQFGGRGLCRYRLRGQPQMSFSDRPPGNRPLLLCGPTDVKPICFEPNNTFYLDELLKRLSGESFQATNTTNTNESCSPHPRDYIKYAISEISKIRAYEKDSRELIWEGYEYLFNTLENHWIDNSQFCNRTGGFQCTKSVTDTSNSTGICEFSQALLDELEAEEICVEESSHHSVRNLSPTLLFIILIIVLN